MRIMLMTHPLTIKRGQEETFGVFPPLGIAYIAAMLEKGGHEVKIMDCFGSGVKNRARRGQEVRIGLPQEEIFEGVRKFSPDIVGISNNFTLFESDALRLARLIKERYPAVFMVLGGAHATMAYKDMIAREYIDCVVRGEGEYVMRELADACASKTSLSSIKGVVWKRDDGVVMINELREPIADLDLLPVPAYHLLDMALYMSQRGGNFAYSKNFPVGHIMGSRGCLYNCIFCSTSKHFKRFRARSAENILKEIEFLIRRYRVKEIHFHDDSFLCSQELVRDFCDGLMKRKMRISWQVSQGITVWDIDTKMLALMQKSGMYRVGLPIESGSKKTLKFIRKPVDLDKAIAVIDECARLGIYTHGNFIIGFPNETREDVGETVVFINKSNIDFIKLLICQPLCGSDLYEVYVKNGLLEKAGPGYTSYEHTRYDTFLFTARELNSMRVRITKQFFIKKTFKVLTPGGFIRLVYPKINSPDKAAYFVKLAILSLKRFLAGRAVLGI